MNQKPSVIDEIRRPVTLKDIAADRVARTVGSWSFILVQTVIVVSWVAANIHLTHPWDPYPFILMNLVMSLQAAYTAPIIMMSQNRQNAIDRIDANLDYEINRLTSRGVQQILERLDEHARELAEIRRLVAENPGYASGVGNPTRGDTLRCVPPPSGEDGLGEGSLEA